MDKFTSRPDNHSARGDPYVTHMWNMYRYYYSGEHTQITRHVLASLAPHFWRSSKHGIWPTESTTLKTYFRLPMISSSWQPLRTKLKPVPLKMFAFGFFRLKLGFIVSITTMVFPSKTFNMPSIREGKDGGREPAQCSSYWKMVK